MQIDTISVVQRAHEHVFWSRQPAYDPSILQRLMAERRVFEYWTHAASYVPMSDYRYYVHKMRAFASAGRTKEWMDENRQVVTTVRRRIRSEGGLAASDFETLKGQRGPWWGWKPAKQALECLFNTGELMVGQRRGFQRVYDLAERVLPAHIDASPPDAAELARWAVRRTLINGGVCTAADMRWWNRDRDALAAAIEDLAGEGEIVPVAVRGWNDRVCYALADSLDATASPSSRRQPQVHILSPFDNMVIRRELLQRLFGFEYTIECYVPAPKRRFGYFCLPVLWGQQFVGRLDAKAERKDRVLALKKLTFEPEFEKWDALLPALAAELRRFAAFNDCDEIRVDGVSPGKVKVPLRRALRSA